MVAKQKMAVLPVALKIDTSTAPNLPLQGHVEAPLSINPEQFGRPELTVEGHTPVFRPESGFDLS